MNKRIYVEDLLLKQHYPILEIINQISDKDFLRVLKDISNSIGFGVNTGACSFPEDLDDCDLANGVGFEGVEFGLHIGEEVVIDYRTFYYYLNKACERYCEIFPSDKEKVSQCLQNYIIRYSLNG